MLTEHIQDLAVGRNMIVRFADLACELSVRDLKKPHSNGWKLFSSGPNMRKLRLPLVELNDVRAGIFRARELLQH